MNQNVSRCSDKIKRVLSEKRVSGLGVESGFSQRLRKLTPVRALWTFVTGMAAGTANSIADFVRLFADLSGESMSYKPFHDRLSVVGFPAFLRECLASLMTELAAPIVSSRAPFLKDFKDIIVQDGSSFAVNPALAEQFPGRFTKVSPAAIEVHCTYSLYEGQPVAISVAPDSEAERHYLPEPEELSGKLILGDRGYSCYEYAAQVKEAGGDYLGRVSDKSFNPKILKCFRGPFRNKDVSGKKLKDLELPKSNLDLLIEGKGRQIRLVLYYVKRMDKHIYLLTTLCPHRFAPGIVASLYRLRWQIELFFKECKSFTGLKKFSTKDPHIVEGLVWASMLAILIRRFLLHSAFRKTGEHSAPFIAASLSWTFFRDLGRVAVARFHNLGTTLERILRLLRTAAKRTNPQRTDTFTILCIDPVTRYA